MKIQLLFLLIFLYYSVNAQDCINEFDELITIYEMNPKKEDIIQYQKEGQILINNSFDERIKLHKKLSELPDICRVKMKSLFTKMREREDYIGAHYYKTPQVSTDSIDYKKVALPIYSPKSYAPFQVAEQSKFAFKNGDILITKGISFTSSTISEVVSSRALFSHIVFLHVDEKTKIVSTMESYIGYGVKIYPIEEALRNENARILVLRAKDKKTANTAANFMFEKITSLKKVNKTIPYDYKLDFSDNSKLSCEEIAYDAFKYASNGKMILPENLSQVDLKDTAFLDKIGVKPGALMMPSDMEIDSRFDIVLDWRDYKIIRDSIRKDAVMGEMFHWMNEHKFKIHNNFRSIAARVVWSTRYIPGLWHLMAVLSGIPSDFQKDVPPEAITTLESLKSIAGIILEFATLTDEKFHTLNGRWMTSVELRKAIDLHLQTQPQDILKSFHN